MTTGKEHHMTSAVSAADIAPTAYAWEIQATGLKVRAGRKRMAVDGLDLSLGTGVHGLLGPNGAGKTTLIRTSATVLRPTEGPLDLLGESTGGRGEYRALRRRIGYLPQEFGYSALLQPRPGKVRLVNIRVLRIELKRSASVHVGRTIWLLGLAATGFALLVAATPRARLLALTPVLAGAALALLVLPSDPRRMYVVDEAAAERVCDGSVCVTKTHQARLTDLAGPGKEAPRPPHGALGGQAPVSVRENTAVRQDGAMPQRSRKAVFFDFDDDITAAAKGEELTWALIAKGMVPGCAPVGWSRSGGEDIAQTVAVGRVFGDIRSLPGAEPASSRREVNAKTRAVWRKLKALPRAEQLSRIDAMRTAALSCKGDAFDALNGGASR